MSFPNSGTFNVSGSSSTPIPTNVSSQILDEFGGTSIAVIALTVFNFFAAILAAILIIVDNRGRHKTWKIAPSKRIPLYLAVAIAVSHLFFLLKDFNGLQAFQTYDPPNNRKVACKVFNELGFWAIWAPLVTMVVRVAVAVLSISFHFDSYTIWMEGTSIFLIALVSLLVYLPVHIIAPATRCLPFVLIFLGKGQMQLAMAATAILTVLLLFLVVGLLIIGFDTAMLKRNQRTLRGAVDVDSGQVYIEAQQKKNPDRKLIFYGAGLVFQYVPSSFGLANRQILLLPNFILGSMGNYNTPLNLLASVSLHLDGVVVLLQYLFGHRYIVDPCPHCQHPWHPNDSGDTFHRPYSARVGQWWRRSYIDSRSFITATAGTVPSGAVQFPPSEVDQTNSGISVEQVRRLSGRSLQRPSMRQIELPDAIFNMPKLSISVPDDNSSILRSSQSSHIRGSTRKKFSLVPQRSISRVKAPNLSQSSTIPRLQATTSTVAADPNSIGLPQKRKLLMSWKQSCKITETQENIAKVARISSDAPSEHILSDTWLPLHYKEFGVMEGPMSLNPNENYTSQRSSAECDVEEDPASLSDATVRFQDGRKSKVRLARNVAMI